MKLSPVFIIIAVGCLVTFPILIFGTSFLADDGVTHAAWYINFSHQLWAGTLYPRWLPEMNNGLGSPVFYYYPPLPFFITSLLKPLFPNDLNGWHQLGISSSIALTASGLSAYLWLKDFTEKKAALISAILYMIEPYHLVSDLYIRGAFAEFWAFVWLPLILYFTSKVIAGHGLAVAGLALSYSFLIMTHLPTTLIFSGIPLIYAVIKSQPREKLKGLGKVTGSMLLGIGLSAIYLYPAMTTQSYVFLDRMGIGFFSYKNWLFFSGFSMWTDDNIRILLLVLDLAGAACSTFFIAKSSPDKNIKNLSLFWFACAMAGVLMMTDLSRPVWMLVSPLQKIQFPWRFNLIISLAVSALSALAISSMKKGEFFSLTKAKVLAFLLIMIWVPIAIWAQWNYFDPGVALTIDYRTKEIEQKREVPEYRPRWNEAMSGINWETSVDEDYWDQQMENEYNSLIQRTGMVEGDALKVKILDGNGQAEIISRKSTEIRLHIKTSSEMKIQVSQFYFPNWNARIIGEQRELTVVPSHPDGLINLTAPEGDYLIQLNLDRGSAEFTGQIISLITGLFLLVYVGFYLVRRKLSQ